MRLDTLDFWVAKILANGLNHLYDKRFDSLSFARKSPG
jgi:hypothetical protein